MTYREKVDASIAGLIARGVNPYTAAPPAWRLAWILGAKVPPPHFMSFSSLALISGGFFGVLWGVAMWFVLWGSMGLPFATLMGLTAGALFGLSMGAYYRHSASKLKLPPWEEYRGT